MNTQEDTPTPWIPPVEVWRPDLAPQPVDPYSQDPYYPDPYA